MSESTATSAESSPEPAAEPTTRAEDLGPVPQPPSEPGTNEARARRRRRVLRAVGRWTAAVTAFGILGTGITYGIMQQERTDMPGLATADDGRWDYPELTLPALPPGAPRPFSDGNPGEIHHGDVRELLLAPPEGAAGNEDLPDIEGEWVPVDTFIEVYEGVARAGLEQRLVDDAVRHIAARGWTMPDGTRTSIYLLQFNGGAYANSFYVEEIAGGLGFGVDVVGSQGAEFDESWPSETSVPNVARNAFDEPKPRGETHVRQAYLVAGDTLAVVVQSRKGTAHSVPFQQTVILQSQLLG